VQYQVSVIGQGKRRQRETARGAQLYAHLAQRALKVRIDERMFNPVPVLSAWRTASTTVCSDDVCSGSVTVSSARKEFHFLGHSQDAEQFGEVVARDRVFTFSTAAMAIA